MIARNNTKIDHKQTNKQTNKKAKKTKKTHTLSKPI